MERQGHARSLAATAAAGYTLLVLYASLYPFVGWRWPPGMALQTLLTLPWPPWRDRFDEWINLAGYFPLGLLAALAMLRSGRGWLAALLVAVLASSLLSYVCEVLQQFVPTRHPSLKDWAANSGGAAAGALVALALHALGLSARWHELRTRWFEGADAGALLLLALWPLALLFPTPVPLGVGHLYDPLRTLLASWLNDVPWAAPVYAMLAAAPDAAPVPSPLAEASITTLGLLAPCLIAYATVRPFARRVALALVAFALAVAMMTLSTLLNFGPAHALAWVGRLAVRAFGAAALLALALAALPRAVVIGCGLVVLGALVAAVAQTPTDPYYAQSLQAWEQGRFVRFHGLAQWVGWLWPYAAIAWFLAQLGRRR